MDDPKYDYWGGYETGKRRYDGSPADWGARKKQEEEQQRQQEVEESEKKKWERMWEDVEYRNDPENLKSEGVGVLVLVGLGLLAYLYFRYFK